MIEIASSTATQRRPFLPFLPLTVRQRRWRSLDDAAPTSLAIVVATPNLIPMPAAHAPLDRSTRQIAVRPSFQPLENRRSLASNPHRSQRRDREPLPARDFVPWRFSDACRGSGGWFCDAGVRETCTRADVPFPHFREGHL